MGKINRFEDIIAWQKSRELNKFIYEATLKHPFVKDFALVDQVRRSSISILSNIAEGFERKGVQEFIQFLNIAIVQERTSRVHTISDVHNQISELKE